MYELKVQREFCAAHALMIKGQREPVHGHNWRVTAVVSGAKLDADGLLCDFHVLERALDRIIAPLHNADLNHTPPFDRINPSAELVAKHIFDSLEPELPTGVTLERVGVTEAPGCEAIFRRING